MTFAQLYLYISVRLRVAGHFLFLHALDALLTSCLQTCTDFFACSLLTLSLFSPLLSLQAFSLGGSHPFYLNQSDPRTSALQVDKSLLYRMCISGCCLTCVAFFSLFLLFQGGTMSQVGSKGSDYSLLSLFMLLMLYIQ